MRNPLIDNAKGVLIFLVVLGHYLEAVGGWDNPYLGAILSIIYLFHMPAFVFLTGVTAKKDRLGERIANLAIILVVFQFAYVVLEVSSDGEWPVGLFQPFWILWFLLSLIWWTLLLPLIARVPYAFAISIMIAAVAGLYPWDGYQISVMRTLTFLPFFVGGRSAWQPHYRGTPSLCAMAVSGGFDFCGNCRCGNSVGVGKGVVLPINFIHRSRH